MSARIDRFDQHDKAAMPLACVRHRKYVADCVWCRAATQSLAVCTRPLPTFPKVESAGHRRPA